MENTKSLSYYEKETARKKNYKYKRKIYFESEFGFASPA